MREDSDTDLVKRFQRGDEQAFADFAERHRDRLYRMACVWVGDAMLAQDAVQEAFVRSYTGLGRFRFRAAPSTWLIRVCRNVCLELRRRQAKMASELDAVLVEPEANEPPSSELPEYLRRAVAGLPARQRDVVVMRLLEDMSVRETARVLGCREGTVKAHLAKGLKNLRTNLGEMDMADLLDD